MQRLTATSAIVVMLVCVGRLSYAQQTVTFEQTVDDLRNDDPAVRLKAVRALEQSAYPEAAVPLAALISDPQGAIRLEAIRAELNLFLVDKIVPRKRVGFIVEVRNSISAEAAFTAGPDALEPIEVPPDVLNALRMAAHDQNPQIALEALYAFGTLASSANGPARTAVLAAAAPDLAGMLGVDSADMRRTTVRVAGRLFEWRPGDPSPDRSIGDALVTALNERQSAMRITVMEALGAMRYERAVQALTDSFTRYERGSEAAAALNALARIAHSSSEPLFVAGLTSRDSAVRAAGIEGLARLGDTAQAEAIDKAVVADRNDAVALAGQFARVRLLNAPIDLLVEAVLRSRSREVALRYLAEAAPGRTSAFAAYAQSQDPQIRAAVADVLGRSADAQGAPIVERLQQDADPSVSRAAVRALARLGITTGPPLVRGADR
jgi:HEAT repeat protein